MEHENDFSHVVDELEKNERAYEFFVRRIVTLLDSNPDLSIDGLNCVHSVRYRKKDRASIKGKCLRKFATGVVVTDENCFDEIEDYFGVRLLHLHLDQLPKIHTFLTSQSEKGEFSFGETPKAYTWDPEFREILESMGFNVEFKESFYTSVHYILKNSEDSPVRCELQVRTLFEETWGELDHWMNYPKQTDNVALKEQLLVLSRVVTAGSRLAVSIHRIQTDSAQPSSVQTDAKS